MIDKQDEPHRGLFERRRRVVAEALEEGPFLSDTRRVLVGAVAHPLRRGVHEGATRPVSCLRQ